MMKLPIKYWVPLGGIATVAATELTLRLAFGLGNPALLQADPEIGYYFQPNQEILRFGKHIRYNQYAQRSDPITLERSPGTLRILMTGDSVLNGGNPTDQPQTITELFKSRLQSAGYSAEVLNASAGSWAIGNQLAYLTQFGLFNSDAVILQIGTHDLLQPTSTSQAVGRSPYFPNRTPKSAIAEAWSRYFWPNASATLHLSIPKGEYPPPAPAEPQKQFEENMILLAEIISLVRSQNIPVFVLFTPDRQDLVPNYQTPPYKPEFFKLLEAWQVPAIDSHAHWSNLPTPQVEGYFRDIVHLNEQGNQAIADLLFQKICVNPSLLPCQPQP
ncbi:SGNH/GDSL hydrolase family protein [Desertifilum sp. FACHB-868]|uniref:Lysophospholipase n=2 Tax=Desertifilum TaxID=1185872 RepID=A0A1E5QMN9_9CYAN|nr:SGNH/GDSL hydrolase family protein [Desertifilum sp. FACHB-868]MDA0208800.1 SGNH/GDSL hydrolase family protein [Cyanobacteria bacterium FC1]OEJ75946.1 lysophospholipase [Desertifilum tharense IPPAS B-1220]